MSNRSKHIERSPVEKFPGTAAGFQKTSPGPEPSDDKIWACLLHLSSNFASGINKPRWSKGPREEFEPELSIWLVRRGKIPKGSINNKTL